MGAHTQAPWVVARDDAYPFELAIDAIMDGCTYHVALVHGGAPPDDSSIEANAQLIATAPELLDALKHLLAVRSVRIMEEAAREYPHGKEDVADVLGAFDVARAVIAKAEGRS